MLKDLYLIIVNFSVEVEYLEAFLTNIIGTWLIHYLIFLLLYFLGKERFTE